MLRTDPNPYGDSYGKPRPFTGRRFKLYVAEYNPDEEPGWMYQLRLYDQAYVDSDGFPIDSVPAGDSWPEAFAAAGRFMDAALASDRCVF